MTCTDEDTGTLIDPYQPIDSETSDILGEEWRRKHLEKYFRLRDFFSYDEITNI